MKRAVSLTELNTRKRKLLKIGEPFGSGIGRQIEHAGVIFLYGDSRHGKSSLTAQLAKYFTNHARVAYDSLEEGLSLTLKLNFQRVGMADVKRKLIILDRENLQELRMRLKKPKAPSIVVIDSIQYIRSTWEEFKEFLQEFSNVLFIIVSQVKGKLPKGTLADAVYWHADVKIWVEGFRGFPTGRYGGGEEIIIWQEGADKYWANGILKK